MPRASTIYEAAAVCDPELALPAGHEWYVDLSAHRGANVTDRLYRAIRSKEETVTKGLLSREHGFCKLLLTGLRGSGKTTELRQFCGRLEAEGYFPVFISGDTALNLEQLTNVELLLSLVWALQEEQQHPGRFRLAVPARVDEELNLTLASILVEEKDRSSAETKLESAFGIGVDLPFFVKVKSALKSALATSTEKSSTYKTTLIQRTSSFIITLNRVLDEVQANLRAQGCKGLVFIVDEPDRLLPREAANAPGISVPQLLFEHQSEDLKAPRAHAVYTFPSQLLASVYLGYI